MFSFSRDQIKIPLTPFEKGGIVLSRGNLDKSIVFIQFFLTPVQDRWDN